ncbi:hypothetical protein HDU87_007321 [Geranomyces variabilis]|uniref:Uncharacterized protein n=1 Tax=Geranomyces variabilis TaxID=109894 RepID=A0AAD5TJK5_9FUNG|nr:hypothetical protein HDU87_007321 [Geranomyces variabilis]
MSSKRSAPSDLISTKTKASKTTSASSAGTCCIPPVTRHCLTLTEYWTSTKAREWTLVGFAESWTRRHPHANANELWKSMKKDLKTLQTGITGASNQKRVAAMLNGITNKTGKQFKAWTEFISKSFEDVARGALLELQQQRKGVAFKGASMAKKAAQIAEQEALADADQDEDADDSYDSGDESEQTGTSIVIDSHVKEWQKEVLRQAVGEDAPPATPTKGKTPAFTLLVTPCKPVITRKLGLHANDLAHICKDWSPNMTKLIDDIKKRAVEYRSGDMPALALQVAQVCATAMSEDSWPRDREHANFAQYTLEHYVHLFNLTSLGDISMQNAERKFIVESLSYTFFAVERIFGAAEMRWLEMSSTTIGEANFQPLERELNPDTGAVAYRCREKEDWPVAGGKRNFDILVHAKGTIGNFVLVEVSGAPVTQQHTSHPLGDTTKLDGQAKRLLMARLLRYARISGELAKKLAVYTIQTISNTLTVLEYRMEGPQNVGVTELLSFAVPMSKDHHVQAKAQLVLGWLLKQLCQTLKATEQEMAEAPPGTEGETIRDWVIEDF